jgi:hypothetical protein
MSSGLWISFSRGAVEYSVFMDTGKRSLLYYGQLAHLLLLTLLTGATLWAFFNAVDNEGRCLGWSIEAWLWLAICSAVAHQVWVWFWWRTELYLQLPSRTLGDGAFKIYSVGFVALAALRFSSVVGLAIGSKGTAPISGIAAWSLAGLLCIPIVWLFYSIARYFGFRHALGADHFMKEHRARPLCREGIFRFVPNAMYTVGFFILWIPGIFFASTAALLLAAFNHAYIWVHYYCTEEPDMRFLYGASQRWLEMDAQAASLSSNQEHVSHCLDRNRTTWAFPRDPFVCVRLGSDAAFAALAAEIQSDVVVVIEDPTRSKAGYQSSEWLHTTLATIANGNEFEELAMAMKVCETPKAPSYEVAGVHLDENLTVLMELTPSNPHASSLRRQIQSRCESADSIAIHHVSVVRLFSANLDQIRRLQQVLANRRVVGITVTASKISFLRNLGGGRYREHAVVEM